MEDLINQAFDHIEDLGPHVREGHYDLEGPEGELILKNIWETTVQPGWQVTMKMWPQLGNHPVRPRMPPNLDPRAREQWILRQRMMAAQAARDAHAARAAQAGHPMTARPPPPPGAHFPMFGQPGAARPTTNVNIAPEHRPGRDKSKKDKTKKVASFILGKPSKPRKLVLCPAYCSCYVKTTC